MLPNSAEKIESLKTDRDRLKIFQGKLNARLGHLKEEKQSLGALVTETEKNVEKVSVVCIDSSLWLGVL